MGAPIVVVKASNTPGFHCVKSIAPEVPAHKVSKNTSRSFPAVLTTPAPVITTLWSSGKSRTEDAARTVMLMPRGEVRFDRTRADIDVQSN